MNTKTYKILISAKQFSKIFSCRGLTLKIGRFYERRTDFWKKIGLKTRLDLEFYPENHGILVKMKHGNHEFSSKNHFEAC